MRGLPNRPFRAAAIALGLTCLLAAPALAHHWRLEKATLPTPFLRGDRVDVVIEPSGVEPIGDGRRVLVAHDNAASLHVVDVATGRARRRADHLAEVPPTSKLGPKWEGMALDSEGNYYLVGAHSGKTDEERAASGVLLRFRLQGGELPAIDDASVVRWDIARSLEAALKAQGLDAKQVAKRKIEGLAIREAGGPPPSWSSASSMPDDKVRAFAADITAAPSPDAELELSPLFTFDAGAREGVAAQLTSLEYVPALGGFLVVTASEDEDNAFHGNTLWFVPDGETRRAREVATFEVAMKAEGLAVLGVESAGRPDRRQAPDHLRQRPARDQDPQPVPDGDARARAELSAPVTGLFSFTFLPIQ